MISSKATGILAADYKEVALMALPKLLRLESAGLNRMSQLDQKRLQPFIERIGFDVNHSWGLVSVESYQGSMRNLVLHADRLYEGLRQLDYKDRKTFIWSWPKPEIVENELSFDSPGILQLLHVPNGVDKPDDLSSLEFVDIHSQLLARIGLELIRVTECVQMWRLSVEQNMRITSAGISRNLIESCASFFYFAKEIEKYWTACKVSSGLIHETSTGGRVDRKRAIEAQKIREFLRSSRYELKLNDSKELIPHLTEWRHPDLISFLRNQGIKLREETVPELPKNIIGLVRDLSGATTILNNGSSVMMDYELLCNVVHPSMGGFRLYSSAELTDPTYGFSYTEMGRGKGVSSYVAEDGQEVLPFGRFAHAISQSAISCTSIYIEILSKLVMIADDIALTADVKKYTFHESWRYPTSSKVGSCDCEWSKIDDCKHEWGSISPTVPSEFKVSLAPIR